MIRYVVLALAAGCAATPLVIQPPQPFAKYAAVVDARFTGTDGQVVQGAPRFHTIAAALGDMPPASSTQRIIFIRNGRYREKLIVDKPHITFEGESRDSTVLTFDATASTPKPEGGALGTGGSFTLRIADEDFRAEHLTIENSFDYARNSRLPDTSAMKIRNTQAVALQLFAGNDRAVFIDCLITGWQDTLYANAGRAYFQHSVITGNVDFIFGGGVAVFDECEIISRAAGYITAPSTPPLQRYGFVFYGSKLSREPSVKEQTVFLGRPWHPSSNPDVNPSAVFIDNLMDDHIAVDGWTSMGTYGPETARFFEYESKGQGAVKHPSRRTLNIADVAAYSMSNVLGGWKPQ